MNHKHKNVNVILEKQVLGLGYASFWNKHFMYACNCICLQPTTDCPHQHISCNNPKWVSSHGELPPMLAHYRDQGDLLSEQIAPSDRVEYELLCCQCSTSVFQLPV